MVTRLIPAWSCRLMFVLCAITLFSGCGGGEGRTLSLDKDRAREACKEFLETWKSGGKRDDLEPDIIGRDEDWDAGNKLTDFELLPDARDGGSNLHITARLTQKTPQGRESKSDVVYVVGTSPHVTVFRE